MIRKHTLILLDVATGIISVHPRLAVSGLATTGVASPSLARYRSLNNIMHCTTVGIAYFMYRRRILCTLYDVDFETFLKRRAVWVGLGGGR